MKDPNQNYIKHYNTTYEFLKSEGWIPSPWLTHPNYDELISICKTDDPSIVKQREITKIYRKHIYSHTRRNFFVKLFSELSVVNDLSFMFEKATIHLLKKDFFSTIMCLTPVIEGMIRRHADIRNFNYTDHVPRKLFFDSLTDDDIEYPRLKERYLMYKKSMKEVLENYFFQRTSRADFSFSFLNRHYISHSLGSDVFYNEADVFRLFIFVENYLEMLHLEYGGWYNILLDPSTEKELERIKFYENLNKASSKFLYLQEEKLMNQHKNYASSFELKKEIKN